MTKMCVKKIRGFPCIKTEEQWQ